MSTNLSNFPEMGDFRYEVAAYHLNNLIKELDADDATPPVGVSFDIGGDWLQDSGAFKLNTLTQFLTVHKGATGLEILPDGVDWQYLNQSRLLREIGTYSSPSGLFPIDTVIVFGASIMAQSFSTGVGDQEAETLYAAKGATVTVHNRAVSGDTTTRMLSRLPDIISEFGTNAERTLFVIHWGGNDVSAGTGYPDNADTMEANCRSMLQTIKDAGFKIALSDITYRIPPASNPTDPYNQNVMNPLISEFADIALSFYGVTFENQDTWFEVDGVHPNANGEAMNRNYVVDQTVPYFSNLGPIPSDTLWTDVILQFGMLNVYPDGSNEFTIDETVSVIKNTDLTTVTNSSVTLSGSGGHSDELGRGNVNDPSDTSISLTNNGGLLSYVYKQNGAIVVDLSESKIEPDALYTVSVTASRDAVDLRENDVTVGGVTKILNVTASPVEVVSFTNVLGSTLMASGISVSPTGGTGYAYLGMVQITKE